VESYQLVAEIATGLLEPRLADLPAKNRELVPEHENLELLLRSIAARERHHQLEERAHTRMYSDDTRKDDLQQTGSRRRRRLNRPAPQPADFLHPTSLGHRSRTGCRTNGAHPQNG
jgi:hypothetical protein